MLSKLKVFRYAGIFLFVAMLGSFLMYPVLKGESAATDLSDAQKQMELLKAEMEKPNSSPALGVQYNRLANIVSDCGPLKQIIKETGVDDPLAPAANLCINGALAVADPAFNRPLASSTGTGIGNGTVGNCSLSGSGTAVRYDVYSFNLTGCAAFPTVVTAQLCGPAGCVAPGAVDTMLILYRNVAAGDPLTANGGLPAVFNPASACTNARAGNDDSGATPTSPGGSTCNQLNTADCLPQCPVSTSLSEFKRSLGSGRFTIVVAGFGNTTGGSYNLFVDAPAAGCAVALAPTAAGGNIGGQVKTTDGRGISNAIITISGGSLPEPKIARTSSFGYYNFDDLAAGETYTVTVQSKRYTFTNSSQVVTLQDNATDVDFVSEQ